MRAPYLPLAFLILFSLPLIGQKERARAYELKAEMLNEKEPILGYLADLKDSTIWISPQLYARTASYWKLPVNNIESLKFRRKGSVGRGLLIGGLSGFAAGAIVGLASGSDEKEDCSNVPVFGGGVACVLRENARLSAGEKALVYGLSAGTVGMLAGIIIGTNRIVIPINGNLRTYRNQRERLRKYQPAVPQN